MPPVKRACRNYSCSEKIYCLTKTHFFSLFKMSRRIDRYYMPLRQEEKERIAATLRERGIRACAACGQNNFTIVDEIAQIPLSSQPNRLGEFTVPSVVVVCTNCGDVRFHSLGVFGLGAGR